MSTHGYTERLLDHGWLIRELTGLELCSNKCTLLLSGGPPTQAVRDKAADKNTHRHRGHGHHRNGRAYQRGRPAIPLEDSAVGGRGYGWTRRHGRAALRGISRALALQQGYMLAQIAEEIHAPDRAAQDTGEGATVIIRTWV